MRSPHDCVRRVRVGPRVNDIVAVGDRVWTCGQEGAVRVWDAATMQPVEVRAAVVAAAVSVSA